VRPFRLPVARGRIARPVRGQMNGSEQRYAHRLELLRITGQVAWWAFEPVKFRLADKTWYTPDFLVMQNDGALELHELKGWMEEDANVKLKVTSETYWMFRVMLVREKPKDIFNPRCLT